MSYKIRTLHRAIGAQYHHQACHRDHETGATARRARTIDSLTQLELQLSCAVSCSWPPLTSCLVALATVSLIDCESQHLLATSAEHLSARDNSVALLRFFPLFVLTFPYLAYLIIHLKQLSYNRDEEAAQLSQNRQAELSHHYNLTQHNGLL